MSGKEVRPQSPRLCGQRWELCPHCPPAVTLLEAAAARSVVVGGCLISEKKSICFLFDLSQANHTNASTLNPGQVAGVGVPGFEGSLSAWGQAPVSASAAGRSGE